MGSSETLIWPSGGLVGFSKSIIGPSEGLVLERDGRVLWELDKAASS